MAAKRSRFHVELDALLLQLSATGIEVCGREAEVIDRAPLVWRNALRAWLTSSHTWALDGTSPLDSTAPLYSTASSMPFIFVRSPPNILRTAEQK